MNSSNQQRLVAAAQDVGTAVTTSDVENMASLLDMLGQILVWAGDTQPPVVSIANDQPPNAVLAEAAQRARLCSEGGAYIHINTDIPNSDTGSLQGVTFAVKDLLAVAGRPIGAASAVRENAPPEPANAPVVAALLNAGAILVGTTTLHEFAFGVTGINDYSGTPHNPHDPTRIPGGSSSGSAVAVAEGSAQIAVGTDTGGSVRIPAALCGVVGFKPSLNTYPTQGVFPLAPTLDHVGFFARSVEDIQTVHSLFEAVVDRHMRLTRVGVARAELARCESAVRGRIEIVLDALQRVGCVLVDVDWPDHRKVSATMSAIVFSEAAAIHKQSAQQHFNKYGPDVQRWLLQGLAIPAVDYVTALRTRQWLIGEVQAILSSVDCVIGPTVSMVAPTIEETRAKGKGQLTSYTRLANVTGVPALSLPVPGLGLPVGLQITASDNQRVLGIAALIENLLGLNAEKCENRINHLHIGPKPVIERC